MTDNSNEKPPLNDLALRRLEHFADNMVTPKCDGKSPSTFDFSPDKPSESGLLILQKIRDLKTLITGEKIKDLCAIGSQETLVKELLALECAGRVERPNGPRGGYQITADGIALVDTK